MEESMVAICPERDGEREIPGGGFQTLRNRRTQKCATDEQDKNEIAEREKEKEEEVANRLTAACWRFVLMSPISNKM